MEMADLKAAIDDYTDAAETGLMALKDRLDRMQTRLNGASMPEPTEHSFWLVWRLNGGAPTYRHHSFEAAESEAKRLSRANPGERFVVLQSIKAFELADLKTTHFVAERDECDIPF